MSERPPPPPPDDPDEALAHASTERGGRPKAPSERGDFAAGSHVGPYRVLRKLGQGGMGAVYLAVHGQIDRQVAIKVLRAAYSHNPDVARRFLNEARAVNRVRHPSLVQIFDHGQLKDGTTYLIMEYLDGTPLSAHIKEVGGKLPEDAACRLCRAIAQGLLAAHGKRIVHRDLKPDNVMLVPDELRKGAFQVKLLDFGIAKNLEPHTSEIGRTEIGTVLGTPAYMSPEQIKGVATVDERTDVYSLGIMLYQMLAGRLPFDSGGGAAGLLGKHLYEEPKPLAETAPGVSLRTATLVHAMLAKDPADRPSMGRVASLLKPTKAPAATPGTTATRRIVMAAGFSIVALSATALLLRPRTATTGTAAPRCSSDGWCQEPQVPAGHNLRRGHSAPGRGLWVVGDQGAILHRGAAGWRMVPSGTTNKLVGLFVPKDGPILIAGDQGTLLSGEAAFRPLPLQVSTYWTSIYLHKGGSWIAGKDGALLRLGPAGWEPAPQVTQANLYDLCGFPDGTAWAVGRGGTALHFDGRGWQQVSTGTERQLQALFCAAPGEVWAAGKHGLVLRFDGQSFRPVASGTDRDLNGLHGTGPGALYAVGDQGIILHIRGDTASIMQSGVSEDLHDVFGSESGEVYAVGSMSVILRRR